MAKNPKAEVEVTAESRTLGAKLREARSKFTRFGSALKDQAFGSFGAGKKDGFLGKAGASLVGNLGASGLESIGGMIAGQARGVFAFNDALARLQITASATPEEMKSFSDSIRKASDDVGISRSEILAGSQAYVALTGDFKGAAASARVWARVAQATGSSVADIAQTAAALKQQLNITPDQMESSFAALAAQGKAGAIELKDLAGQLSTIAPQWAEFANGKSVRGVAELGAALQIVKRGFGGDASETVTGLQSMLNSLIKNAKNFKAAKIDIFTKDPKTGAKSLKSVFEIVDAIAESKLVKDPTKLEKAFGRVEAYRAFLQLRNNRSELDGIVKVAGDASIIQKDLTTYLDSTGGKTALTFERAKNAIADAFTPERIEAFTKGIEGLAEKIGPVAESFGRILDVYNKIYNAGKAIRGAFTPDESKLASTTFSDARKEAKRLGVSPEAAFAKLQTDHAGRLSTIKSITSAMDDDKTTLESDKRAVAARFAQPGTPGYAGIMSAGTQYIESTKLAPDRVAEILKMVRDDQFKADVEAGRARSTSDMSAQFLAALKGAAPDIGRSFAQAMQSAPPLTLKADGKALVEVHRSSSTHARRPGG